MNRPNNFPLYIARGATLAVEVEYLDRNGDKVPFGEGWAGHAQVRSGAGGTLRLALAVVLEDPGVIVASATAEATAAMAAAPALAVWDLLVTDPDGNVWPMLAGPVDITTVVTEI